MKQLYRATLVEQPRRSIPSLDELSEVHFTHNEIKLCDKLNDVGFGG
jgi:hypothetical protein